MGDCKQRDDRAMARRVAARFTPGLLGFAPQIKLRGPRPAAAEGLAARRTCLNPSFRLRLRLRAVAGVPHPAPTIGARHGRCASPNRSSLCG